MSSPLRRRGITALSLWWRHGVSAMIRVATNRLYKGSLILHLFGLVDPTPLPAEEWARSVTERQATREEVDRLVAEGRQEPDAIARFDHGDRCLLQSLGGRFAGLVWISTRPVVDLFPGVGLRLPEDAVYSYRTWTEPEFRGNGLQARRHRAVLESVRAQRRVRLLLFVASTNFESLRGVRRSGCKQIGTVRIRKGPVNPSFTVKITDPAWSEVCGVKPVEEQGAPERF